MDVKIVSGDIGVKPCGDALYIDGFDEIKQRVMIACSIKKGDFVYDTKLGTSSLCDVGDELVCDALEMIIKEATINVDYDNLEVLSFDKNTKRAVLKLTYKNKSENMEVTFNG